MKKKTWLPLIFLVLALIVVGIAIARIRQTKTQDQSAAVPVVENQANLMTEEAAKNLFAQKLSDGIEVITFFAGGYQTNPAQTLPEDASYQLVMNSQMSSIQALYDYAYSVYSPALAETEFYLAENTTGVTPRFKEKDGFLYANEYIGGRGVSSDWDTESLKIVSQSPTQIVATADLYRFGELIDNEEITLIKDDRGNWVFASPIDR